MNDAQQNQSHVSPPCVLVIFGAAGDLTKRKLIPALYNLKHSNILSDNFAVVGVARAEMNDDEFRRRLRDDMNQFATEKIDEKEWEWLSDHLYYLSGDFEDEATYERVKKRLEELDQEHQAGGNYCFYLSSAPRYFAPIVKQLGGAELTKEDSEHWRRVVIEKPFGRDLESARELNREIQQVLKEDQIYRIDHYLGKETVQNILVFRFGNSIFEPIWNRRYIDSVQITAAEKVGVEQRGGYYESAGAVRARVRPQPFQLGTATALGPPQLFQAHAERHDEVEQIR